MKQTQQIQSTQPTIPLRAKRRTKADETLTLQEIDFVDKIAKGKTAKVTAVQEIFGVANYSSASVRANRLLNNDRIKEAIEERKTTLKDALLNRGVTPDKIALKVDELLEAITPLGRKDYASIDKGLKHATAIFGVIDLEDNKHDVRNTYNFIFSAPVQEEVKKMEATIKSMLIKKSDV